MGYAITCSFDRGIELYENSFSSKFKTRYFFPSMKWIENFYYTLFIFDRACRCWDVYRTGKCDDKLSNYMGKRSIVRKAEDSSFRYFVRTSILGNPLGDTSNLKGYGTDFVYKHDRTCEDGNDPRNIYFNLWQLFLKNNLIQFLIIL